MSTAVRSLEEVRLLMDRMAHLPDRRDERDAAARLRESSHRAKRKVEVMNELIRDSESVVTTGD
jgi:hypothetical protein